MFPRNRGWALQVEENGTIRYEHYLNDDQTSDNVWFEGPIFGI